MLNHIEASARTCVASSWPWVQTAVSAWTFLLVAADLKSVINGHIHWAISLLLALILLPIMARSSLRIDPITATSGLLLAISIIVSDFLGNPVYGLIESIKLLVIVIGGLTLFRIGENALAGFRGIVMSVYVNMVLLVLGLLVSPFFASKMAAGRWGTVLAHPGSLWRVGIAAFIYSAYRLCETRISVRSVILFISSTACVILDGTRTGILLLGFGCFYLLLVFLLERRIKRVLIIIFLVLSFGLFGILALQFGEWGSPTLQGTSEQNGVQRVLAFISATTHSGLSASDPIRFQMIQDAIQGIEQHPLVGSGIGTTKAETPTGPMVVHMSYLQVWADLGVFGFIAYLTIVIGWVYTLPRGLLQIRGSSSVEYKALFYNSIFVLLAFAVTGLFHPLSTEWSEWTPFLIAYAFIKGMGSHIGNSSSVSTEPGPVLRTLRR